MRFYVWVKIEYFIFLYLSCLILLFSYILNQFLSGGVFFLVGRLTCILGALFVHIESFLS